MKIFRLSEEARKFAREVGIIVLGVLIALAAQQAAEAVNWYQKATEARAALRSEALQNYADSAERITVTPCLGSQLDLLKASVLNTGSRVAPVQTTSSVIGQVVYRHPNRLWSESSWQSTLSDQVPSHLFANERQNLSDLYTTLSVMRQLNREEMDVNGHLAIITYPIEMDANIRTHIIETIEAERLRVNAMAVLARQQMDSIKSLFPNIELIFRDKSRIADLQHPGSTSSYCRANKLPLNDIPT